MTDKDVFESVKVTNLKTNISYKHYNIPIEHVEILRLSPNLLIEPLLDNYNCSEEGDEKDSFINISD